MRERKIRLSMGINQRRGGEKPTTKRGQRSLASSLSLNRSSKKSSRPRRARQTRSGLNLSDRPRARFYPPKKTVPCVGRDTRKPPLPPPPLSPLSDIIDAEEEASTTTLPSSPLGTGTGGGEEGRADLAKAPGAERPRYDHMRGRSALEKRRESRPVLFRLPLFFFFFL